MSGIKPRHGIIMNRLGEKRNLVGMYYNYFAALDVQHNEIYRLDTYLYPIGKYYNVHSYMHRSCATIRMNLGLL